MLHKETRSTSGNLGNLHHMSNNYGQLDFLPLYIFIGSYLVKKNILGAGSTLRRSYLRRQIIAKNPPNAPNDRFCSRPNNSYVELDLLENKAQIKKSYSTKFDVDTFMK